MRIVYISLIIRLLILSVSPAIALAAEVDPSTLQNTKSALIKIENGQMSGVAHQENLQTEQLSNSILQPEHTNTLQENKQIELNNNRISLFSKRLNAYTPPKGKITILVTGYSSTVDQCDGDPFTTASGTRVHKGTMACPPQYPFGTKITIDGVGTFVCEDRGGAIKGNHFDMWFTSRGEALAWGKRTVEATIAK